MKRNINYILIALFFAGCSGGGNSGSESPTPKDNVESKITDKAITALTGQTAIFEASHQVVNGNSNGIFDFMLSNVNLSTTVKPKVIVQAKVQNVNNKILSNACKINMSQSRDNGTAGLAADVFIPTKMKISGVSCPIEISMDISIAGPGGVNPCVQSNEGMRCRFNAIINMNYHVVDDNFARELQVKSGSAKLSFNVDQVIPTGQAQQTTNSLKEKSNFDIKVVDLLGHAYVISGQQDIDMTMLMSAPSQEQQSMPQIIGGMKEDLQYSDQSSGINSLLSATIIMNGSGNDEKYLVDGVAVTAQSYQDEHDKFANSMMKFSSKKEDK